MLNVLLALQAVLPQDFSPEENYEILSQVDRVTPVVRVVQAAGPAVVYIETEFTQRGTSLYFGPWQRTYEGSGSGVVVRPDGYIVTNYHVVKGAGTIRVSFDRDPTQYEAEVVSFVRSEDLALLKIQADGPFPVVRLGTSSDLFPGERVVAIGNPYGQTHTVSNGIISGLHRNVQVPNQKLVFSDLIQTDASINYGNSGGPLLNIQGELIGINTAMNQWAENIGFAIPVDRVRDVLTDTLYPQARKGWLGFELDLRDENELLVGSVVADGPAALAGICEGDRVRALAGQEVATREDFLHASLVVEPGEDVEVVVEREDGREAIELRAWDRLDGVIFEHLGMRVREEIVGREQWILVGGVAPGGPADELGLAPDDWIPAVRPELGRHTVPWELHDRRTLAQILEAMEPGAKLDVDVYRDDDGDRVYARDELYKGTLRVR